MSEKKPLTWTKVMIWLATTGAGLGVLYTVLSFTWFALGNDPMPLAGKSEFVQVAQNFQAIQQTTEKQTQINNTLFQQILQDRADIQQSQLDTATADLKAHPDSITLQGTVARLKSQLDITLLGLSKIGP